MVRDRTPPSGNARDCRLDLLMMESDSQFAHSTLRDRIETSLSIVFDFEAVFKASAIS